MAIVLTKNNLSLADFRKACGDYESYLKITIDIEQEITALGGEYHADAEKILLEQGSKQKNIWGGGINLETGQYETMAMVNLRAGRNNSTDILDAQARNKFLKLAQKILQAYV
ncbi:MAG: DUF5674 family protein [Candidatus Shapirobacteria bacterium]